MELVREQELELAVVELELVLVREQELVLVLLALVLELVREQELLAADLELRVGVRRSMLKRHLRRRLLLQRLLSFWITLVYSKLSLSICDIPLSIKLLSEQRFKRFTRYISRIDKHVPCAMLS